MKTPVIDFWDPTPARTVGLRRSGGKCPGDLEKTGARTGPRTSGWS